MTLLEFITNYFTLALVTKLVERRTPVSSTIFERVFTNRVPRGTSRISLADILRVTKSMPVISRGGQAIPLERSKAAITLIEPLAIRLSDSIKGSTMNDLRTMYGAGGENGQAAVASELDRMVLRLMTSTELTRNALCAQALTGKIDYMMDSEGVKERYVIDYGATQTYTPTTALDDQGATLVTLSNILSDMRKKINTAGYSGRPMVLAGRNAFSTIANLVMATDETARMGAKIDGETIRILGYEITLVDDTYNDTDAGGKDVVKESMDPNSLCMVMADAMELDYCAIDDFDVNDDSGVGDSSLVATPFFTKTIRIQDPSAIQVISESKPMPLVASQAICWATVTSSDGARTKYVIAPTVEVTSTEAKVYTESSLNALTKAKILEIAAERGYEMTKTSDDTKSDIVTEFLSLQAAVNGEEE